MKHLLTFALFALGLNAIAQFPNLPYNPDENGDGLIGVVDLQGLLANYGSEFSSAVLSEDGESAITFLGEMGYFECNQSCRELPGFWELSSSTDLALVAEDLNISDYTYTWIPKNEMNSAWDKYIYYQGHTNVSLSRLYETQFLRSSYRCYCSAVQLPRVEYTYCEGTDIQECANEKVGDGWMPLSGISSNHTGYSSTQGGYQFKVQAFWRWAE